MRSFVAVRDVGTGERIGMHVEAKSQWGGQCTGCLRESVNIA